VRRTWLARMALWPLPPAAREAALGDLLEEASATARGPGWVLRQALGVAAHHHAEAWRNAPQRLRIIGLALAVALPWALLPAAAELLLAGAEGLYADPASNAALAVWRQSGLVAAVAAGLLLGALPGWTRATEPARGHLAVLMLAGSLWRDGPVAALLLVAALWLARRRAAPDDPQTWRPT
jgi:hypothetical protein